MTRQTKALKQLGKASKLADRTFHKNGPKSFKKGQGTLLKSLNANNGEMTSRQLVEALGYDRKKLKDIVKKAERNGYVNMIDSKEKRTYIVRLTEAGQEVAQKRCEAQKKVAEDLLSTLSEEEIDQLNAATEKIILQAKELGAQGKHKKGKKSKKHHGNRNAGRACCHSRH